MAEHRAKGTDIFTRQMVEVILDLNRRLRSHGIHLRLAAPNIDQQLIDASQGVDHEDSQALRQRLIEMQACEDHNASQAAAMEETLLPEYSSFGVAVELEGGYLDKT